MMVTMEIPDSLYTLIQYVDYRAHPDDVGAVKCVPLMLMLRLPAVVKIVNLGGKCTRCDGCVPWLLRLSAVVYSR